MIECNSGSFEVLGAIDNLSFSKLFKCIHTSLSSAGNQVWVNHLTRLQQSMSDPEMNQVTNQFSTNQTIGTGCIASFRVSMMDDEIQSCMTHSEYTQSYWIFHTPLLINSLTINSVFINRAEHHGFLLTTTKIRVVPDVPWCWKASSQTSMAVI